MEGGSWQSYDVNQPSQSIDEILSVIQDARQPLHPPNTGGLGGLLGSGSMDFDDVDADVDLDYMESSGEFV